MHTPACMVECIVGLHVKLHGGCMVECLFAQPSHNHLSTAMLKCMVGIHS